MSRFGKWVLSAAATAAVTGGSAQAAGHAKPCPPAAGAPCPCPTAPYPAAPYYAAPSPLAPGSDAPPAGTSAPLDTGALTNPVAAPLADTGPSFASTLAGAGLGETAAVAAGGYIDNATPVTMFRLQYDSAYNNNRPDRASFFYAQCGCFGSPGADGPPLPETSVDSQEIRPYFEYAFVPRLSAFVTVPVRFINPVVNTNEAGLSDIDFGLKYALIYCPDRVLTLQTRIITPSGDSREGLGTNNWWIEPGLLYLRQVNDRWQWFGEVRDQIPLGRTNPFAGNVLRYGLGTSVTAFRSDRFFVAPVVETVGWTVLSGREFADGQIESAEGDTIVNAKLGVRIGLGAPFVAPGSAPSQDLYIGYGRALTGEVWYKDMLRIEYRKFF